MASLPTRRPISVTWYFRIAAGTAGLLAVVDRRGGDAARRVHDVGQADHARDHLLDALEAADRHVELPADARVGAGGEDRRPARRRWRSTGSEMQRPDRQLLDQHAPAAARPSSGRR